MTPCSIVAAATRLHTTVHGHVADVHGTERFVSRVDDDENDDTFLMRHHRPHKIKKRAVRRRKSTHDPPLPHVVVDVRLQLHASRY